MKFSKRLDFQQLVQLQEKTYRLSIYIVILFNVSNIMLFLKKN